MGSFAWLCDVGKSRWVLKWLISLSLLALVLAWVPVADIARQLAQVKLWWVTVAFGLLFLMRLVSALRMRVITRRQGMTLSISEILKIGLATSFFGLFLPGYIASGAVRWHLLCGKDRKRVEALASVVFDRINDTFVVLLAACLCLAATPATHVVPGVPWLLTGALVGLLLVCALLLNPWTRQRALRVTETSGPERRGWLHKVLARLTESLARFRQLPLGLRVGIWGLSLLFHSLGALVFYLLAGAMSLDLGLVDCFWLRATLHLLFMLPLSVSGIGVRETALVVLLAPFGISSAQAVAYSFLMMTGLLVMAGIGGLLAAGLVVAASTTRPE
ncbi:MAG: lysylphosphatidylglycerol synthase transmembrane domain-containing protein [Gammaproteobacteria bacterium]|jgi:uncharacterized protein (TIRG00374 family)